MSREFTRTLAVCQESNHTLKNYSGEQQSPGDMIFGFLEEGVESSNSSWTSGDSDKSGDYVAEELEDDNDVDSCTAEKNKVFWESQDQLLLVSSDRF